MIPLAIAAVLVAAAAPADGARVSTCRAGSLVVWLDTQPGHTAGSTYYTLELTNLSAAACTLRGYPGVSAVAVDGRRVGAPAGRNPVQPARVVTLARHASAIALLRLTDVHNIPRSACRPVTAAGLRVYPPGYTRSTLVPFPFPSCTLPGAVVLHVGPVQHGR